MQFGQIGPFRIVRALAVVGALGVVSLGGVACTANAAPKQKPDQGPRMTVKDTRTYTKPSVDDLKKKISPMQFEVTQKNGTEPPFRNAFWDNKTEGLYVDVVSGEPLFSSRDKFDSGTGWPSFTRPVDDARIVEKRDGTHGMVRVEVRSKDGDSHLGHLFDDGPKPTNLRYCINSASLRFIPATDLQKEGYEPYVALFQNTAATENSSSAASTTNACAPGEKGACETSFETAVLAGGCFWGMEDLLRGIPGVVETDVGYAGGKVRNPTYDVVKTGRSGHAESVRVVFDPKKLAYADLLEHWFFRMHDPTTENRQGNDVGSQYRSAIFYTSDAQKKVAEDIKAKVDKAGKWGKPIVTEIVAFSEFTDAEGYHQDYLEKHPDGYTCHFMRD